MGLIGMTTQKNNKLRCVWCGDDPLYRDYHDNEWGVPVFDDQKLFEFLILEGMQAGLSWITILRKRENFRKAFSQFKVTTIARYPNEKLETLLQNPGIIRNRRKVYGVVQNAKAFLKTQEQFGTFSDFIWRYTEGKSIINKWRKHSQLPATTSISDVMSKDLKKMGYTFIGSTICYAFMQAVGMVNDHCIDCYRYHELIS